MRPMDPTGGLVLMALQLGVQKTVSALAGEDFGGLASALMQLVGQAERSQDQLLAMDRKLDLVLDQLELLKNQRFEAELADATRLAERAIGRRQT